MIALNVLPRRGLVPPRISGATVALALLAGLCGCAGDQRTDVAAAARDALDVPISVTCTLNAATAEPCRSDAERQCDGAVRLLNVTVAEALPRPMADQSAPGQRVYQATYSCR